MRRIDFWAGVPLCWFVTLADRLLRAVGVKGRGHGQRPRHILFIQLAEMGTMVVAYPALRRARELFPDATLHFLCFGQVRASLEMLNVIAPQHIYTIDSRSFTSLVRDTLRTWSVARRNGIDTVVNLETFVRYSSLLSYLTGAARRVGFHRFTQEGLYTGDFLQGEDCGDWIFAIRSRLGQLHVRGLFALGQAHESRGRCAECCGNRTEVREGVCLNARDRSHLLCF